MATDHATAFIIRTALSVLLLSSAAFIAPASSQPTPVRAVHTFNFSGASASDMGIYRPGQFWYFKVSQSTLASYPFGADGDVPIPADYDGDGRTDHATYRPSTRELRWDRSSDGVSNSVVMGNFGDMPIVADFDGDGKTDLAIFRPSTAQYWFYRSSDGVLNRVDAGQPGDLPVVGDFDGDGKDEAGIFNVVTHKFSFSLSSNGARVEIDLGVSGDTPLVGDFDGDGKADAAVYHPETSTFTYRPSSGGSDVSVQLGQHGDIPLVGDYDGDGKTDVAVFHPQPGSYNVFFYRASSTLQTVVNNFGNPYDIPLGMRYETTALAPALSYSSLPNAPQLMYQSIVPHTDKYGALRNTLGADSFFPRCAYETVHDAVYNMFPADQSQSILKDAGFNCFKPAVRTGLATSLQDADAYQMQAVWQMEVFSPSQCPSCGSATHQIDSNVAEVAAEQSVLDSTGNPALSHLLGWDLDDEPTGWCFSDPSPPGTACPIRQANITNFASQLRAVDPNHPIFLIDIPPSSIPPGGWLQLGWLQNFVDHPSTNIASIDTYPFVTDKESTLEATAADYLWASTVTGQTKPLWILPQLFTQHYGGFNRTMPSPEHMRAQVFTALVHGATGIFYFAMDSAGGRNGQFIGIGPAIPNIYGTSNAGDAVATADDIARSTALWSATVAMNKELQSLQGVILSPTSTLDYQVAYSGTPVTTTPLRSMLKKSTNGVYTLLLVNIDDVPLDLKVSLPGRPIELFILDKNGARYPMGPYGSTFTDSIERFGVRKYEFK
jgi:hypothetical protein